MTFDQLLTLDAIIKTGSFKAASEKLHKTQPSISIAIKKLEEEFQLQIFNREEYRPRLTPMGKKFYEKAKLALYHMQSLNSLGQELAMGVENEIKVGVDVIIDHDRLLPHLRDFFCDYPKTNLSLTVDVLSGTFEKMEKGQTDLSLLPLGQIILDEQYDFVPFSEVMMIPVISNKFFKTVKAKDLIEIPQIVVSSTGERESRDFGILKGGRQWRVTDINIKKSIIKSGLGWGSLPEHLIEKELQSGEFNKVKAPGVGENKNNIFLVRNNLRPLGPVGTKLWEMLKNKGIS